MFLLIPVVSLILRPLVPPALQVCQFCLCGNKQGKATTTIISITFRCRDINKNWDGGYLYYPFLHSTILCMCINYAITQSGRMQEWVIHTGDWNVATCVHVSILLIFRYFVCDNISFNLLRAILHNTLECFCSLISTHQMGSYVLWWLHTVKLLSSNWKAATEAKVYSSLIIMLGLFHSMHRCSNRPQTCFLNSGSLPSLPSLPSLLLPSLLPSQVIN